MRAALIPLLLALAAAPARAAEREPPEPITALPAGMVGAWFPPAGDKDPLILVLGGSEGGLRGAQPLARSLSAHGYGALAVAYFDAPGLPAALKDVPLEGLEAAIDWLRAQPGLAKRPIAVVGASKGGELALLIASRDPRLCAVVAGVPSSVVWAGIDMKNPAAPVTTSSWSWQGKPLAFAPYAEGPFRGVRDLYERSLAKAPPEAAIPVEKIHGPVLLISGKADQLWPSTPMADAVIARLDARRFAWPHSHLSYGDAGHAAFGPPLPASSPNLKRLASLGGTPEGNNAARADGWPKALAFLDRAFEGKSCRPK
ncbi:MAG: dienelactone hydrolase [Proteobacteria bacterium]|nr:dienelactone hydrolase [Pseudomonadota bacterium]